MARPLEMTRAEFERIQKQKRGLLPPDAVNQRRGITRRQTGEDFEKKLERAAQLYMEHGRAYIERFEPKRLVIRGEVRFVGRGRPDWIGVASGYGVLFDSKAQPHSEASFKYDLSDRGQVKQLESLIMFAKLGRAATGAQRTRAFLLLHDDELRLSPAAQEKGLQEELVAFSDAVRSGEWAIPWWQQAEVARASFAVEA